MLLTVELSGCGSGGGSGLHLSTVVPHDAQVFALTNPSDSAAELTRLASLSTVDGLAFRAFWSSIETADSVFSAWDHLDAAADAARAQGKMLTIHIDPQNAGLPSWLSGSGVVTYTYVSPVGTGSAPIPWDAIYLQLYGQFVAEMANHLSTRGDASLVKYVSVAVPVPEMSLADCESGVMSGTIPYDRTLYLNAWKTSVLNHVNAFVAPEFRGLKFLVSAPARDICHNSFPGTGDADGASFYSDLMTYALTQSANMAVFAADLNADGSLRLGQVSNSLAALSIDLQTLSSKTTDPGNRMNGTLLQAVCQGRAAGGRDFEIYKDDLDSSDPSIQSAIAAVRNGQGC